MACDVTAGPSSSSWSSGRLDYDQARRHHRADEDGVVVVPRDSLDQVLEQVLATKHEGFIGSPGYCRGLPLLQALEKYGHL